MRSDSSEVARDQALATARRGLAELEAELRHAGRRELGNIEGQVASMGAACPRELLCAWDEAQAAASSLAAHLRNAEGRLGALSRTEVR